MINKPGACVDLKSKKTLHTNPCPNQVPKQSKNCKTDKLGYKTSELLPGKWGTKRTRDSLSARYINYVNNQNWEWK